MGSKKENNAHLGRLSGSLSETPGLGPRWGNARRVRLRHAAWRKWTALTDGPSCCPRCCLWRWRCCCSTRFGVSVRRGAQVECGADGMHGLVFGLLFLSSIYFMFLFCCFFLKKLEFSLEFFMNFDSEAAVNEAPHTDFFEFAPRSNGVLFKRSMCDGCAPL